jgi:hypothetical protein
MQNSENVSTVRPSANEKQPLSLAHLKSRNRQENDKITLVLFKGHHAPRSFEVTLGWFKRAGVLLGALVLISLASVGIALRLGWTVRSTRPQALEQLREENRNLRTMTESLEVQLQTLQAQSQMAAENTNVLPSEAQPSLELSSAEPTQPVDAPQPSLPPAETRTITQPNGPTPAAPQPGWFERVREAFAEWKKTQTEKRSEESPPIAQTTATSQNNQSSPGTQNPLQGQLFLPTQSWPSMEAVRLPLKIALTAPQVQLRGSRLQVKFAIQYTAEDGKNQQGRIILLARGPSGLMAYPEGVLNDIRSATLIAPERGEFFSVGRYREVMTEFELPASKAAQWKEIEVLIFNSDEVLLIRDPIDLADAMKNKPKSVAPPPGKTSPRPAEETDPVMGPGTDR